TFQLPPSPFFSPAQAAGAVSSRAVKATHAVRITSCLSLDVGNNSVRHGLTLPLIYGRSTPPPDSGRRGPGGREKMPRACAKLSRNAGVNIPFPSQGEDVTVIRH